MVALIMWRFGVGIALLSCIGAAAAQESETGGGTRGIGGASSRSSGTLRSGYPASFGTYHALLIGVSDYDSAEWNDLPMPKRDVDHLAKVFRNELGWKTSPTDDRVTVLKDSEVTLQAVKKALTDYAERLDGNDNLLIWFAGHGSRDPENAGRWSWIMHDGTPFQFHNDLEDYFDRIKANHLLVISDSCFAGPFSTASTTHGKSVAELARLQGTSSRQLITSGDVEEVPDGGKYKRTGARSPFAAAFIGEIESISPKQRPRTAWEVFAAVRSEAMRNAPEGADVIPQCGYLSGNRNDNGQFFFVHPGFFGEQKSREDARKRTRLSDAQWNRLVAREVRNERTVYTLRGDQLANDDAPMVLVDKTYVPLPDGSAEPIAPFLVDVREVTVRQFKAFLADNGERSGTRYLNLRDYDGDQQPVVGVTLAQARGYAAWAGKQLPDEYQWLAAAALSWNKRGDAIEVAPYPWSATGEDLVANPIWKAYPPEVNSRTLDISPWGAERMGTGVREWCLPADRAAGIGVIRGGTVVRVSRRDASLASWLSEWKMPSRGDIPRANVGFRCIVPLD